MSKKPGKDKDNDLAKVVSETQGLLDQEKKSNILLRNDAEKKIQIIRALQDEINAEHKKCEDKKVQLESHLKTAVDILRNRVISLKAERKQLLVDVAGIDVAEEENEILKGRVRAIMTEHAANTERQRKEKDAREKHVFDTRMNLEQILQQVIKQKDDLHISQSNVYMESHADTAKRENQTLREAFDIREKMCFEVLRQQQASFDELAKLRVKRAVVADTMIFEDQNAASLLRKQIQQERVRQDLELENRRLEEEIVLLQYQAQFKKTLIHDHKRLQAELSGVRKQREKAGRASTLQSHLLIEESLLIADKGNPLGTLQNNSDPHKQQQHHHSHHHQHTHGHGHGDGHTGGGAGGGGLSTQESSIYTHHHEQALPYEPSLLGMNQSSSSVSVDMLPFPAGGVYHPHVGLHGRPERELNSMESLQESELTIDAKAVWHSNHSNCGQVFSNKTKRYLVKLAHQQQQTQSM